MRGTQKEPLSGARLGWIRVWDLGWAASCLGQPPLLWALPRLPWPLCGWMGWWQRGVQALLRQSGALCPAFGIRAAAMKASGKSASGARYVTLRHLR